MLFCLRYEDVLKWTPYSWSILAAKSTVPWLLLDPAGVIVHLSFIYLAHMSFYKQCTRRRTKPIRAYTNSNQRTVDFAAIGPYTIQYIQYNREGERERERE